MHRMRDRLGIIVSSLLMIGLPLASCEPARADLIRPHGFRSFPDIAGDLVGKQTYSYDPTSQTGIFRVSNAPHVIAMGPKGRDMVDVLPDETGTLTETLELTLDRRGRLVDRPDNSFELYGSVKIGGKSYEGLLLKGTPTEFGADGRGGREAGGEGVFDLNLKVTEGALRDVFGTAAYLRITPQANSTFGGDFAVDFSGDIPLTSLRAAERQAVRVPEPSSIWLALACGGGYIAARRIRRRRAARKGTLSRPGPTPTASRAPRSRSGAPAPSSARATRRSP